MLSCPVCANQAIPAEFRAVAAGLFPFGGYAAGKQPSSDGAEAFAEILGVGAEYRECVSGDLDRFLGRFQNNLDLLIQKTWVEKADESRKEDLQDRVPAFIALIKGGDFRRALAEFGVILEELAYLFFGAQSRQDDFTEYTFRIDTQMGLFWWYGGRLLGDQAKWIQWADQDILRAVLFLGIAYLTAI